MDLKGMAQDNLTNREVQGGRARRAAGTKKITETRGKQWATLARKKKQDEHEG